MVMMRIVWWAVVYSSKRHLLSIHLCIRPSNLQAIHPSTHLQRLCFKPNILLLLVIFLLLLMLIIISIPTHLLPLNQL
jgi:hypothetical protein